MQLTDAIVLQSPLSIALYDVEGRLAFGNAAYERHFGVRVADVPRSFSLFTDPQLEAAGVLELIRRAYAGETVVLPPVRYDAAQAADGPGHTVWTEGHCFPLRDGSGAVTHLAIVHLDVTAWAATDAALRELTAGTESARIIAEQQRARLDEILAQLPVAVAVYEGPEHRVRAMSAAYRRMIGGREVLGQPVREALADLAGQGFFEHMDRVFASGEAVSGAGAPASWDADGDGIPEPRIVDFTYGPLTDASGRPDGVVAVVSDVTERARSQEAERAAMAAAAESSARLAALLESLPDAAAVCDAEWRYTYLNPAARALHHDLHLAHGSTPAPGGPLGSVPWELFPALADTEFERASREAVAGGRVIEYVAFDPHLARWFDTRVIPTATGVVSLTRDITAQRTVEQRREQLIEAERRVTEQHAALLESIQDAFMAMDRELRITYVNRRAEELYRRPAAALLGLTADEAFPEARGTPIRQAIGAALERGESLQMEEYSAVTRGWVNIRISPAPDGVTVLLQDITARRRTQEATKFMADASRLLSESLDYAATLRAVAEAAVPRLADWCAVDILAEPVARQWPPVLERVAAVHRDPARRAAGVALAGQRTVDWSARAGLPGVLRDGAPMFVPVVTDADLAAIAGSEEHLQQLRGLEYSSIIVVPLVAHGNTLGAITFCLVRSERRYDEQDLALAQDLAQRAAIAVDNARHFSDAERARRDAEEANLAKSQFLATMSHELRTPLNAIAGHVQLIDLGLHGPVTDAQHDALARVDRAQRHLLGLINDVLNFARIESGYVEYEIGLVDLADVVRDVLPMVEPQLMLQGLSFQVQLDPPPGRPPLRVLADREKLGQILLNLISNAIKFTPSGGQVTVELIERANGTGPGNVAFLRVQDTGIGIPDDKLEAIFDPFVQVRRSAYTPGGGGTGLGLAISRDLARGMGGDVRARSRDGQGSSFTVSLPTG